MSDVNEGEVPFQCAMPGCTAGVWVADATCGSEHKHLPWEQDKTTARERLLKYVETRTARMLEICKAKNADYGGSSDDPFANFARVEALGICKAEVGFLTRITDKLARITTFVSKGALQVKDESVEDTCLDAANYFLLLGAYIAEKRLQERKK